MPERVGPPPPSTSLVWKRPENVGRWEEVRGFGGVVATLLAGFSLTAVAQLASADDPPPLTCLAVLAFTSASVLLLFSVQSAFLTLRYSASPEERLAWHPEARVHPAKLHSERKRQAEDRLLGDAYYQRARYFFNVGLIMFFAGLALTVVPDDWNAAWIAAVVIAALGGLVEAWWALRGGGLEWPPRRVSRKAVAPKAKLSPLDEVSVAALRGEPSWIEPPDSRPRAQPSLWDVLREGDR